MTLETTIEKILTGNCILFTGSGFGYNMQNIQDKNFLLGNGLANLLYAKAGITEHDNDLKTAAEIFIEEFGDFELIDLIKNEYTVKSVDDCHRIIGDIPWKRVYTTNYDLSLEYIFSQSGKLLTPISLGEKIDQYKDFRKLCVHLNGHINNLTPATLNQEFKLTNTSYLTTEFIQSQWVDLFRSDVFTCDAIVFIGFSMSADLDISRIIAEKLSDMQEKCTFIVGPAETQLNVKKLQKFGSVHQIGISGFANKVIEISKDFIPPQQIAYTYKSFTEFNLIETNPSIADSDFQNLVLKGEFRSDLANNSIINKGAFPYVIVREEHEIVFEKITEGYKTFVFHSHLGNGKTIFLNILAILAKHKGFNVFFFKHYLDVTNSEIEKICELKNTIVIIENYSSYNDILEKFERFRKRDTYLMLSERTIINDTVYDALEEIVGHQYYTFNLNILHKQEVLELSELLSNYGLWGQYTKLSVEAKRRKINDEFKDTIRLTLLDVLKSPVIQNRLTSLVDKLSSNKAFYKAALLILSSNILGFNFNLEELVYLLDDELLNNPNFYNNRELNELIDFNTRTIKITSPILAEGILHTNKYNKDLIPLLVQLTRKLDATRSNKNHYIILKSIISHSRLQRLFNTAQHNDYRKLVIEFFEEVKNLSYSKNNPFFWLQYAMAKLEIRDYIVADQFFRTAYSLAEKRENFDTFQIDNHYSRLLLENEIYNGDIETCMTQFLKAHAILSKRVDKKNKNRHYPFKVARQYSGFYDRFFDQLTLQDKKIFLNSCKEILKRIDEYNDIVEDRNRNRVVRDCFEILSSILLKERSILNS